MTDLALPNNRPSGFSRIVGCPGSRRMSARVEHIDTPSVYAEEGSAAHDLIYRCLTTGTIPVEHLGGVIQRADAWPINTDMVRATSVMVGHCRDLLAQDPIWTSVEKRLKIPHLDMPKGGTGDFIAIVGPVLYVVDYKHGRGVYVNEVGNPQFLCYGHGALSTAPETAIAGLTHVALVCVQPRCSGDPVREWRIPVKQVQDWLNNIAIPAVEISRKPDAPLIPGDHCRWCPAKGFCTAPLMKTMKAMELVEG